jgi:hypothetical protein
MSRIVIVILIYHRYKPIDFFTVFSFVALDAWRSAKRWNEFRIIFCAMQEGKCIKFLSLTLSCWQWTFNTRSCLWLWDQSSYLIKIGTPCCLALEAESPENYNINVGGKFLYNVWSPICIPVVAIRIGTSFKILRASKQTASKRNEVQGQSNIRTLHNYFIPV